MTKIQAHRGRRGFSLIELLVVVGVIGLLLASLTVAGSTAIYAARVKNTQQVIASVDFALEVFREENPLRLIYDKPGAATFGPYPPYQMADWTRLQDINLGPDHVSQAVELRNRRERKNGENRNLLSDRVWEDLGSGAGAKGNWVRYGTPPGTQGGGRAQPNEGDGFDSNRALSTYLTAFVPEALRLPAWAQKPLNPDPDQRDRINLRGSVSENANDGWVEVLGIYDAWGVPLDYFHDIKIEWDYDRNSEGDFAAGYFVRDRRPVLRSLGMDREKFDAYVASGRDESLGYNRSDNWIRSSQLPQPWFPAQGNTNPFYLISDGTFNGNGGNLKIGGWLTLKATGADYDYVPRVGP